MAMVCVTCLGAQNTPDRSTALEYLRSHAEQWALSYDDIGEMRMTDAYTSRHNNVTHMYFVQQYYGVDIYGTSYNVNVLDGEVLSAGHRLLADVSSKIVAGNPRISAGDAVSRTLGELGVAVRAPLLLKQQPSENHLIYEKGPYAFMDIPVRLVYAPERKGQYVLSWDVTVEPVGGHDLWSIRIDATSGNVLDKVSLTTHCAFPEEYLASGDDCADEHHAAPVIPLSPAGVALAGDSAQYNVIPVPFESPNHIERQMVMDPSDSDASPYGWHDLDGIAGADTTITFGNNVHAYLDRNGSFTPDEGETDGGEELVFDFPFDPMTEPDAYHDASVTNLFYMNNVMHDFSYHYGFDEISGNFQYTNYTGTGSDEDNVVAHAQFGASTADPPSNNATFSTPSDGGSGRMRMFLWSGAGANHLLRVEEPVEIAGSYETSTTSDDWGAAITDEPVTGEVVIVESSTTPTTGCDPSGVDSRGCNALENAEDIAGKIALIDRGDCEFGCKALNAQNAGAIAFIICNFQEGYVNMGAGVLGNQVTIPGVFVSNSDCQIIRAFAGSGLVVSLVDESAGGGPTNRASSMDNQIIAHEYGHGISNRLTGGPTRSNCLINYDHNADGTFEDGEQMGEGWSDFFALVTTAQADHTGSTPRGISTYAAGQEPGGRGIRAFAYSTDMSVNPLTYDDIAFSSVPHGIGTVWCSMLWDLYWALVDEYGFDADLYHGDGGNNLAIQLVMDAMKMQVCNPGLADGRDAILQADIALTGGENQRLIWEVFARRGLGYSAIQGSEQFRLDGAEAFDVYPLVIKDLKILKYVTPFIQPGDPIEVELWAVNHKEEDVTEVTVTDGIPEGAMVIDGSASHPIDINGDAVSFDLGTLPAGDTAIITYSLQSSPELFSERFFFDDMENGDLNWDLIFGEGSEFWQLQEFLANSGTTAWAIVNDDTTADQSLVTLDEIEISGELPVLYFYQNYDTERFFDAGIVQISNDNGVTWDPMDPDKIIRGDFSGKIQYGLFAIPNIKAWHGNSDGWIPTIVDLSDYSGDNIRLRFRFGSDGNTASVGWFIDDIEVMDAFSYNSQACITSAEGDQACSEAPRRGTIVASGEVSATAEVEEGDLAVRVYPNPVKTDLTIDIAPATPGDYSIRMTNSSGITVWTDHKFVQGRYSNVIDTQGMAGGMYFIHVVCNQGQVVRKVLVL